MFCIKLHKLMAVGACAMSIAGTAAVRNGRPVAASQVVAFAALSPTVRMLSSTDFWSRTGTTAAHDLDAGTIAELEKLANDATHPDLSLRATKLLCDHAGHSHSNPDLSDADNARAVTVAFEYLESHLADAEVARYAPARGFSHMTVSSMADDGDGVAWILIETAAGPNFRGGLNIRVDLKALKVTRVKQWGDVRPAPAK
ncbi:MAG TPA: hypothetical protein VG326_19310 [Tepidisphaeraceae bacterium]|jgi:hypothetical protein|nr:hypothetical protein [Tepidisphaeraceae bacterium]